MAFIVPVMKKDYMIYSPGKKPLPNVRKARAESNPENSKKQFARPTHLSGSVDLSSPTQTTSYVPQQRTTRARYRSRRISILPLTPETPEEEEEPTTPNSRQVRFGICEEIQYDELENDVCFDGDILPLPSLPTKPKSCLRERSAYSENRGNSEKQNAIESILSSSPKRKQLVIRLLSLCSPKN